jgi:Cu(I)/Ag(I) efflux system membrane fusion protein
MQHEHIRRIAGSLVITAALVAGGYGVYRLGVTDGMRMNGAASTAVASSAGTLTAGDLDPETGRRILYWHDPMVPGRRFDQPGRSPFMNMMLVPVYADGGDGESGVVVSARTQQNLGLRTVEVAREMMSLRVEAAGNVAFNERDQVVVEARAAGFVERLHVRATLDRVEPGQALVDVYVPEWVAAQEELMSLKRMGGADLDALVDAARQRMRQTGMTDAQIRLVEESGTVQRRVTLRAPAGGVLVELAAREGMTVMPGETLFRINGLATVWADAQVPEGQAGLLRPGVAVEARAPALPDEVFRGTLQAILPEIDPATRTITARVELANPNTRLVPGMFVAVTLDSEAAERLTVPTEAVIRTGRRTIVMIVDESGMFHAADVETGLEANGRTEIRSGLGAGQRIVASGQFLIDSEANLRAVGARMQEAPQAAGDAQP